ncbi:hypothetical protein SAMN04489835_3561 [Mycolicibacterium rutilum]|uniref:Uncharacterized protein n=1 Tax=Mycolicibacterium rutilum TaxID=370526 RepID=A0A1H6KGH6_MYCRU|nr:hypothetical protein SAMN04489835_3561 [Mycolicibacterium rutilum]
MAEQRYQAVLAVISDGLSISQVASKAGVSRQTLHPTHIADGRYGPPVISYDVTVVVAVAASVAEINSVALPVRWTVKPLIVPVNGSAFDSPDGSTTG